MVTRKEVAKKAGVSVMTVTRVVSGSANIALKTKDRVEKAISELGYVPNASAANLIKKQNNQSIAVLLQELSNPYYMILVDKMMEIASGYGYTVALYKASEKDIDRVIKDIISLRVTGVLNLLFFQLSEDNCRQLEDYGIRKIFIDPNDGFSLQINYRDAMKNVLERLETNERKQLYFLSGLNKERTDQEIRIKSLKELAGNFNFEFNDEHIIYGNYPKKESSVVGYERTKEILSEDKKCDVLFCLNDMIAFGAIRAIVQKGLSIPEDISVIGFDNITMSEYFNPPLSTISIDIAEEAKIFMDYLTQKDSKTNHTMTAKYICRSTTAN